MVGFLHLVVVVQDFSCSPTPMALYHSFPDLVGSWLTSASSHEALRSELLPLLRGKGVWPGHSQRQHSPLDNDSDP